MDLDTHMTEKCYYSCKSCNTKGDSNNHQCSECGDGFIYKNKEGTKYIDDCLNEYSYLDIETRTCYNNCSENNATERYYNFNNQTKSIGDKPDNYDVIGNNFVRICFYFNNECYYDNCVEGTHI